MGEVGGAGTVFRRASLNIPTPRQERGRRRERERERAWGGLEAGCGYVSAKGI